VIGPDGNVIFADPMGAFSTGSNLDLAKAPGRCRFDPYKVGIISPAISMFQFQLQYYGAVKGSL
jgi:hypothetical protein